MAVRITSDREVAGVSWAGREGTVWATFDRGSVEDWVYVRFGGNGMLVIGFRPDEVEPVETDTAVE